jgi:thioredoxin 1
MDKQVFCKLATQIIEKQMSILYTTDDTFDTDVSGNLPTLATFTATWAGPCKMLAPILDEIEKEYAGRVNIIKVDIDKCINVPAQYSVRGIPTCILFHNGVEVDRVIGGVKDRLIEFLDKHV